MVVVVLLVVVFSMLVREAAPEAAVETRRGVAEEKADGRGGGCWLSLIKDSLRSCRRGGRMASSSRCSIVVYPFWLLPLSVDHVLTLPAARTDIG